MTTRGLAALAGAALGMGVIAFGARPAHASGFQLAEQSARGLGNAFAGGAAYAQDPSTIFSNPAGMTRLDRAQVSGTFSFIAPSGDWKDRGSVDAFGNTLTGGDGNNGGVSALIPVFYATYALDDSWRVGFGMTVPFGLATEWDNGWQGRYQALKSEVVTINLQPSIAYRIDEHWSVGGGVDYQQLRVRLTQAVDYGTIAVAALGPGPANALGLAPQGADGRGIVEGDDWSWGYNLGALWQPDERTRVGVHYRSKIAHDVTGDGTFTIPNKAKPLQASGAFVKSDVSADITLPETVNLSAVHEIDDEWAVMGDVQWTRWSRLQSIVVDYANPAQPNSALQLDWVDTFKLAVGAEYRAYDYLTWRFGFAFDQDPTRDATRSPRLPTDDRWWISVGFTYQPCDDLWLDFGYTHVFVKDGQVDHPGSFGETVRGTSNNAVDVLAVGGTLRF